MGDRTAYPLFAEHDGPRLFGLPPGADFPRILLQGLKERLENAPPEAMACVTVYVNTARMARRLRALCEAEPFGLLPRIRVLSDIGKDVWAHAPQPAPTPLRRKLELAQLIKRLLEVRPALAPASAIYDLAGSLAALLDEMHGEGVTAADIAGLSVPDISEHWANTLEFIRLVQAYADDQNLPPDGEALQRRAMESLTAQWKACPPTDPILIAGSTGSRGTTLALMKAVALLPQGAVILPGFDFDMPGHAWEALQDARAAEDHPQYRFYNLARQLGVDLPWGIQPWTATPAPDPARNAVLSLALRPVPVTDQWLTEGQGLTELPAAMAGVTLVEAPNARGEAHAIALGIRGALDARQRVALITPDRILTRKVSALLDKWRIRPDDSAGIPLGQTPPGRLARHIASLMSERLDAEMLLTILKHPLVHLGAERGRHLLYTRDLELWLRHRGVPYPDAARLLEWCHADPDDAQRAVWCHWVQENILSLAQKSPDTLQGFASMQHGALIALASGAFCDSSPAHWKGPAEALTSELLAKLEENGPFAGEIGAYGYRNLFSGEVQDCELRATHSTHPDVLIWGTLESRVQGADLVILAGLNEGSWPEAPRPDPWFNRDLRRAAGLLLPERRIGLSAHDFQQAAAAPQVWFTRALRNDTSETVASRWIARLSNLLAGLPQGGGRAALEEMRGRGRRWLRMAAALEQATPIDPAPRPAPVPPRHAQPNRLSVTEIKTLVRDPYAVYARHVLRLKPLDPLVPSPDAATRGTVIHSILEGFGKSHAADAAQLTTAHLISIAKELLHKEVPWDLARHFWQTRVERIAPWLVTQEETLRQSGTPLVFEARADWQFEELGLALRGYADRIDARHDGTLRIIDFKTGAIPSKAQQRHFDKQLQIEAALAENGGFRELSPIQVSEALYIGLGSTPKIENASLDDPSIAEIWQQLQGLLSAYVTGEAAYTSRRAMEKDEDAGRYDQLARYGEWEIVAPLIKERMT